MLREFKYYPEDFGKLTVKVLHFDLDFDVFDDYTIVKSDLKAKTLQEINDLELNAQNLEIHEVICNISEITYNYDKEKNKLIISFKKPIKKGKEFIITTKTTCKPTNNILEGLYYDETPKGAPPQMITQCQQWGFQRLVPCIDDMTAKATYITKITADSRYTNIISNGDLIEEKILRNGKKQVVYNNTITPMAPYLFFLGVGTYETFKKKVIYASGKEFLLELLVPPNSEKKVANEALQILHDAIQWINIFTGKEKYQDEDKRKKLWNLIIKRDIENTKKYDVKIRELTKNLVFGYEYTGTVYREIGMQNSNFGGMENVGNTTITTNRIMPFTDMSDGSLEYMFMVKVHEFYHNINGSEVTGRSPFEIWLNEAVTVHIERENSAFLFGKDYHRLEEVHTLLMPNNGTFAMDNSPMSMPIEPDGFNNPDELITSITYVKAPEFVRMIETLMGKEKFVLGLHNYHKKYAHSNAGREQWLQEMELVAKTDFSEMANNWLKKTGFPKIIITTNYSNNNYFINLKQINDRWEFPFKVAICDSDGKIIAEKMERISEKEQTIIFSDVVNPAFVSLNRGYSFYGKIDYECDDKDLMLQAKKDSDIISRYMAVHKLFNKEKIRLLKNPELKVDKKFINLYFSILSDKKLMEQNGSLMLPILSGVEEENYAHHYEELYKLKNKFFIEIAKSYEKELLELYNYYSTKNSLGSFSEKSAKEIKLRQIKNVCLSLLATLNTKEIHNLIKKQYDNAKKSTDRIIAAKLYLDSNADDKQKFFEEFKTYSKKNLVAWELFLHIISSLEKKENMKYLKEVEQDENFRIEQTNDIRALYLAFASNKHLSLCTDEGRFFLNNALKKLSETNEYIATATLKQLANYDKMKSPNKEKVKNLLENLKKTSKKNSSFHNNLLRILNQ